MKLRAALAVFLGLLLVVLAAGCGGGSSSSSSSTGGSSSTGEGEAASQLTGKPLRVGMICACSGPASGTAGGLPQLTDAWEEWVNDNGGIDGHPVEVDLVNDKNEPAASLKAAQQLVKEDKVQAIVSGGYQEETWAEFTEGEGVPVTGGNSVNPAFASHPMFFPSGGTLPTIFYGAVKEAAKAGKPKLAVFACAELPVCAGVPGLVEAIGGKVLGGEVEVVYTSKISATQPNFTAACLGAKEAGADSLLVSHSSEVIARVAESCAKQHFEPFYTNTSSTLGANVLSSPYLNGFTTAQNNIPLGVTSTPGAKHFQEAMETYASAYLESPQFGEVSMNIWSGYELFRAAAEAAKADAETTPEEIANALYTLKDETLEGIAPPLTFVKGQPTFPPCYFVQTVENGEYAAPEGAKQTCIPPAQQKALLEILAAAG